MILNDKNAVIYGAGGGIGRGVATVFAGKGARLFLVGRTQSKLDVLAAEIAKSGGQVETAVLDAFDETAVAEHLHHVVERAGSVDISLNLVTRDHNQGTPLADMSLDTYLYGITRSVSTNFVTARAAARHMAKQGSGVILMLTSGSSAAAQPMMGNTPAADAAMEALMHGLAAELGPSGVRVLGLWTAAVPETLTPESIAAVNNNLQLDEAGLQQLIEAVGQMTMLRRAPALAHVAETAAFLASDLAGSITGTITNITSGMVPG